MNEVENNQPPIPCLAVEMHGEIVWCELEPNGSVLIGSGAHCKVQLDGDGVRSLHCIVALRDGVAELRDWNTGSTLHNGVAITDPVELENGDLIRIFGYEIKAILAAAEHESSDVSAAEPESTHDIANVAEVSFAPQGMPSQIQVEFAQPEVEVVESFPTQSHFFSPQDEVAPQDHIEPTADLTEEVKPTVQAVGDEQPLKDAPQVEYGPQLAVGHDAVSESLAQGAQETDEQFVEAQPIESDEVVTVDQDVEADAPQAEYGPQLEATDDVGSETSAQDEQATEDHFVQAQNVEQTCSQDFVYDVIASLNDEKDQGQFDLEVPVIPSTEVEELRAENEKLNQQLAKLDEDSVTAATESPAEAPALAPPQQDAETDILSREQTLSMISRMQDLVAALKSAEERNRELEEQLQNATIAEQSNPEPAPGEFVSVALATQLRDQVVALQSELTNTLAEVSSLREQASSFTSSDDAAELEATKKELADLQLEVSQEREGISQQRAQLEVLKTKLQEQLAKS